ncbi:MAG: type II toxin-antitoxin system death-on-curing family toxin [Candidatus Ureaplasma intestinipullorum]|uniref:Type II toxin-antitoxin system death-on-curing family toxin n=1 Tax=Candidatus Ureaplasma intestinipullorum TaxID=2838770 RepID=A0A9E2NVR5_9BACT|nr:type II toxin-antitoxin system death-on-curing family toxin [Candidatus Ureaplasma intestinipullorum]
MNTKRIILFCSKNEINNINYYISKKFKNSLISYNSKENEYYFSSKNGNVEKININIVVLQFNEKLADSICEILKWSYSQSQSIVNEHTGPFNDPEIYSEIVNYINLCSYNEDQLSSIFEFIANLFFRYLIGHKMKNGNKRLSFIFLVNLLHYFGYYMFWTRGNKIDYQKYVKEIENWVVTWYKYGENNRDEYIKLLTKWIENKCVIALLWR